MEQATESEWVVLKTIRAVSETGLLSLQSILDTIVSVGDVVRLDDKCIAPGQLAIVSEVRAGYLWAYIPHPVDETQKAYFKVQYSTLDLVSTQRKVN